MKSDYGTLDWNLVKVSDFVLFHDPVKGHHRGKVVSINPVYIAPYTTYSKDKILMTVNHSLERIFDFCPHCGAGIPPREGEGVCIECQPERVTQHIQQRIN